MAYKKTKDKKDAVQKSILKKLESLKVSITLAHLYEEKKAI
jgi:hypothetical protein